MTRLSTLLDRWSFDPRPRHGRRRMPVERVATPVVRPIALPPEPGFEEHDARMARPVVEHVGATAEDGIGEIPPERTVAEIAADGATEDELRDAQLDAWFAFDYDAWIAERAKVTHGFMRIGQRRAERHFTRAIDTALRAFDTSLVDALAGKQLAACHGDLSEMAAKAARPVAVDDTAAWTAVDQAELDAMLADDMAEVA